jgi:8-oxo-dGTP pyrophosphatase MutT (NUDIX family)
VQLEEFGLEGLFEWSSSTLLRVMRGTVLIGFIFVIDRKFGATAKYKLPGGHKKKGETPYDTAVREALGETGLVVSSLTYQGKVRAGGSMNAHWNCYFTGEVSEGRSMQMHGRDSENEGEEAEYFTIAEFDRLVKEGKFLPYHYDKILKFRMIPEMELV